MTLIARIKAQQAAVRSAKVVALRQRAEAYEAKNHGLVKLIDGTITKLEAEAAELTEVRKLLATH